MPVCLCVCVCVCVCARTGACACVSERVLKMLGGAAAGLVSHAV